jgi:predicted TIM-barrel fold metal-dependent hydrolase
MPTPARLIDFHTHTHPTRDAGLAFQGRVGRTRTFHSGALDELLTVQDRVGIARTMIVPWIPAHDLVAERVAGGRPRVRAVDEVLDEWRALNAWGAEAAAAHPDRISTLVGVDPILMDAEAIDEEVGTRLRAGACGIKIAPMFFDAPPDDDRVLAVWEVARRHGVFVLSQAGDRPTLGHEPWGHPRHFETALREFPEVDVVLAHVGMDAEAEVARLAATYPNLYSDFAMRLASLDQPMNWTAARAVEVIRMVGPERMLFASNYPLVDLDTYVETFWALDLTDDERAQVGWRTAEHLLGLAGT